MSDKPQKCIWSFYFYSMQSGTQSGTMFALGSKINIIDTSVLCISVTLIINYNSYGLSWSKLLCMIACFHLANNQPNSLVQKKRYQHNTYQRCPIGVIVVTNAALSVGSQVLLYMGCLLARAPWVGVSFSNVLVPSNYLCCFAADTALQDYNNWQDQPERQFDWHWNVYMQTAS